MTATQVVVSHSDSSLAKIDDAAIAVAESEKVERSATDSFLLACAALSQLKFRSRNDPERPMTDEEFGAAQTRVDETDKARVRANELASKARGKLQRLLKQKETQGNPAR